MSKIVDLANAIRGLSAEQLEKLSNELGVDLELNLGGNNRDHQSMFAILPYLGKKELDKETTYSDSLSDAVDRAKKLYTENKDKYDDRYTVIVAKRRWENGTEEYEYDDVVKTFGIFTQDPKMKGDGNKWNFK